MSEEFEIDAMIQSDLKDLFESFLGGVGAGLEAGRAEVAEYAAQRTLHLSTIVDQPGFEEAVVAERDNVALAAGIAAVDVADEADRNFLALIAGALGFAARAVAKLG